LQQQQLKQKDEIIAALTERLSRIQLETGWLFNVLGYHIYQMVYSLICQKIKK